MTCNAQLLLDGIHAVKVGQEQTLARAVLDDDAVALCVEIVCAADQLRLREHIDAVHEGGQLLLLYGREPRVAQSGACGILQDLRGDVLCRRLERSDAAAQRAVLFQRDEDAGALRHLRREFGRERGGLSCGDNRLDGTAREPHKVVLGGAPLLHRTPLEHLVAFGKAAARVLARHPQRDDTVADAERPLVGELLDL